MQQHISIQSRPVNKEFNWNDFISFRKMITLQVIQIVYIIVAILITLVGLITLFNGNFSYVLPGGALMGFILIVFGNLLWRIWCELIIVLFRINSTLSNIDSNTRRVSTER